MFPFYLGFGILSDVCATRRVYFSEKNMPLTTTKDLFAKALKGKYALGAFNVSNMELVQAIVAAC